MGWIESYRKRFSIEQFETHSRLKWVYFVLIAGFVFLVGGLFFEPVGVRSPGAVCPEYFQGCAKWLPFPTVGDSWIYRIFLELLFLCLAGSVYSAAHGRWVRSHFLLSVVTIVTLAFTLLFDGQAWISYDIFLFAPTTVLLLSRNKFQDLRWSLAGIYFICSWYKLDSSWLAGAVFMMFDKSLPLIPATLVPIATNLVVLLEVAGAWWLVSPKSWMRRTALAGFCLFHLYSHMLISIRFMVQALALLLVLFDGREEKGRPTALAWGIIGVLACLNLMPFWISQGSKFTHEGTAFSLGMFTSIDQAINTIVEVAPDGTRTENHAMETAHVALVRPYHMWWKLQSRCKAPGVARVEWRLVASVNGSPFREVINEKDVCSLKYNAFGKNDWLHDDGKEMGYPAFVVGRDVFPSPVIPTIYPAPQVMPGALQVWLADHVRSLRALYLLLSTISFGYVLLANRVNADERPEGSS